jgi:hypothetical protein
MVYGSLFQIEKRSEENTVKEARVCFHKNMSKVETTRTSKSPQEHAFPVQKEQEKYGKQSQA